MTSQRHFARILLTVPRGTVLSRLALMSEPSSLQRNLIYGISVLYFNRYIVLALNTKEFGANFTPYMVISAKPNSFQVEK